MRCLLVPSMLAVTVCACHGAVANNTYTIYVAPGGNESDFYFAQIAAMIGTFDTIPKGSDLFRANSGSVVDSKPHSATFWLEKKDEEQIYEAKSAPIPKDATSWIKCAGEFKTKPGGGGAGAPQPTTWKSQLIERDGHIILVHLYTGPLVTATTRNADNSITEAEGNFFYDLYPEGGARHIVKIGVGGDVPDFTGVGAFLATKDITPKTVVTVDDLGHGALPTFGPILAGFPAGNDDNGDPQPDTKTSTFFSGSALVSANAAIQFALLNRELVAGNNIMEASYSGLLDYDNNPTVASSVYTAQYKSLIKDDATVSLYHCYTAERGTKTVERLADGHKDITAIPSIAEAFKADLGGGRYSNGV